jgi:membrane-bound lytic murein transglycosylase B
MVLLANIAAGPVLGQTASNLTSDEENCATREACEIILKKYEAQLALDELDIQKTSAQKKTLQNQIAYLKKRAENLSVKIKQSNAVISDLKLQITDTEKSVQSTSERIAQSQVNLAGILRTIDEEDKKSLVELVLAEKELSDFFDSVVYLESLNKSSDDLLNEIKSMKSYLEDQKSGLQNEKGDLEKQVQVQQLEKQEHETTKKAQEQTLKMTEAQYQKSLSDKKATAAKVAQIKSRIFEMAGLGNTKAPNFSEAYAIAKAVGATVGVRPAFLLAILTQESNIGKNVGQCYLKNSATGAGINIQTGAALAKVMNPNRDVQPFLSITSETGRDPYATQVSCPMSYGWGGAMGPAQFIPATWISYRDRVKAITGKPADPWNIRDAFMAAGLYVSDYGAASQTYNGEWRSAMIYFAGSVNTKYRFYGDNVCAIAAGYADDIAAIEGQ